MNSINTNYEVFCVAGGTLALKPRLREIRATPEMLGPILGTCVPDEAGSSPDILIRPEDR